MVVVVRENPSNWADCEILRNTQTGPSGTNNLATLKIA